MKPKIYLIAATDIKGGIGNKGKLPWNLKGDMKFFKDTTTKTDNFTKQNIVIMGRKTWESIPEKHRPLEGRKNIILTRNRNLEIPEVVVAHNLDEAISMADERTESIYIIGGAKVFKQAISRRDIKGIYLTKIKSQFKCDTYFPKLPPRFKPNKIDSVEENGIKYDYILYKKPNK